MCENIFLIIYVCITYVHKTCKRHVMNRSDVSILAVYFKIHNNMFNTYTNTNHGYKLGLGKEGMYAHVCSC